MKKVASILLVAATLASCSIQKRHYLKGFYFGNNTKENMVSEKPIKSHSKETTLDLCDIKGMSLSAPTKQINQPVLTCSKSEIKNYNKTPISKPVFKYINIQKAMSAADNKSLRKGLIIGGWITAGLSLLLALFVAVLFIILLLMGIGLLIWGYLTPKNNDKSNSEKEENNQYQDVVYLKNGSKIKGVLIEQIPNKSLKIQTKDGSIFNYNMDEVEKITKEK